MPVLVIKSSATLSACSEFLLHHFENKLSSRVTLLLDAENSLPNALILSLFTFFSQHYPERLHRLIVIRADLRALTHELKDQFRPFRRQLQICTEPYQATLTRFIPPERLLFDYGGLRKYRYDGGYGQHTSYARYQRKALLSA